MIFSVLAVFNCYLLSWKSDNWRNTISLKNQLTRIRWKQCCSAMGGHNIKLKTNSVRLCCEITESWRSITWRILANTHMTAWNAYSLSTILQSYNWINHSRHMTLLWVAIGLAAKNISSHCTTWKWQFTKSSPLRTSSTYSAC